MAKQVEEEQASSPKRTLIILGSLIAIMVVVIGIASLTNNPNSRNEQLLNSAAGKVETTSADALKASIDLYRVQEGKYPSSYERLIEATPSDRQIDYKKNLPDLDYTVRGDGEAYRFTYTSITGETVTVDGNYSEDYH